MNFEAIIAKGIKAKYKIIFDALKSDMYKVDHDKNTPLEVIKQMTAYALELKSINYRQVGEDEDYRKAGNVVPITKAWLEEQEIKYGERNRLMKRVRDGDQVAITELLGLI